ncbi:hypothetical protein QE429_001379 [Bacillus sp. SORGH_AS 510]|nr:hypothetical protein [Bacillus sp. SORGH_AS_0510]MDQ1144552.1 hypothetical protein [Bacillus sp. SORGH_AS_0510]
MNKKNEFPSREELDEAFHFLHDQINRISVVEEVEMMKEDKDNIKG